MSVPIKFGAGAMFPIFSWPKVGGGAVTPGAGVDWRMLVIYRGAHCALCVRYLHRVSGLQKQFTSAGVRVWALSADPLDRAAEQATREGWCIPVLAELQQDQMRELGLYISAPRSPGETDRNFAEPAIFVINPESKVQIVDVSNAPFARPEPQGLLEALSFVIDTRYPIRGTAG
ncbi:redoxin domain-containing protein [Sphingomonas sp.]|uniref:redoxin domain-containing protein n=1 Tax=Sphingomonas sp. TaxID=28214 RepID=UPI0017A1EDBC|nr:redoxin domain-containing protein [Sphingomonas sp.]MBA3511117.1 redoxin domain-containing protein [Sphingomonas sp.]